MRLASLASSSAPNPQPSPSPAFDDAVRYLDWAHEAAGGLVSDPEYDDVEDLLAASGHAADAARLLDGLGLSAAAKQARAAIISLDSAAQAHRNEGLNVSLDVIRARGEEAENAIHDAFTAMGLDGRGE